MSETRHAWNPCRANTRIAASRICRRLSTGGASALIAIPAQTWVDTSSGQRYAAGRRFASDGRAAEGEDPVELRKAEVVTDGHAERDAGERRAHDLLTRLLALGLAVGDPADVHVEHVDLAVGRVVLAIRPDQHRGVEELLGA